MDQKDKLKDMANKTKVFANQLRGMPDFIAVFKLLANLRLLMCMLVALIMGAGIGLISTFLFWHLQVHHFRKLQLELKMYYCITEYFRALNKLILFLGLWWNSNSVWNSLRYQSHFRDVRILSCYQSYRKNWTCKSTRIWSFV